MGMRIIAHRGLGYGHPENSAAAITAALRNGVDEVEVDVRLTADQQFVLSHSNRYRGRDGTKRSVRDDTLRDAKRHGLCTLDDALALFQRHGKGKRLCLELKTFGGEATLVAQLVKRKLLRRVRIMSFMTESLAAVHRVAPSVKLVYALIPKIGVHYSALRMNRFSIRLPYVIRKGLIPVDAIQVAPLLYAGRRLIKRLQRQGYRVEVVNVDSVHGNERLRRLGCSATVTNDAPAILAAFRTTPSSSSS